MFRWGLAFATILALVLGPGCSRRSEAPFAPGVALTYQVSYTAGDRTEHYDVTLKFKGKPGSLKADFEVNPPEHGGGNLNDQEYSDRRPMKFPHMGAEVVVGQLYLAAADRQVGLVTPTGRITGKRTHEGFDVWAISGTSGFQLGTRFYDQSSGVLVGWNFEGITSKLVSPIPTKKQ
ncbi:MAG: hypothetical protein HY791_21035 [Deltaproteobacteria bacterium]|nr:hypothetical protein [Deltaproteobacteria bacterium]